MKNYPNTWGFFILELFRLSEANAPLGTKLKDTFLQEQVPPWQRQGPVVPPPPRAPHGVHPPLPSDGSIGTGEPSENSNLNSIQTNSNLWSFPGD